MRKGSNGGECPHARRSKTGGTKMGAVVSREVFGARAIVLRKPGKEESKKQARCQVGREKERTTPGRTHPGHPNDGGSPAIPSMEKKRR